MVSYLNCWHDGMKIGFLGHGLLIRALAMCTVGVAFNS